MQVRTQENDYTGAQDFLRHMKGKTLVFMGDSITRQTITALVCVPVCVRVCVWACALPVSQLMISSPFGRSINHVWC